MQGGSKFVEFDKNSGEIVVTLPTESQELRQAVLRELAEYAYHNPFNDTTLDELDKIVTRILLEDSHQID